MLNPKGHRVSIYVHIHNLHMPHQAARIHVLYIFIGLKPYFIHCHIKKNITIILILDMDDENTTHMFTSKETKLRN